MKKGTNFLVTSLFGTTKSTKLFQVRQARLCVQHSTRPLVQEKEARLLRRPFALCLKDDVPNCRSQDRDEVQQRHVDRPRCDAHALYDPGRDWPRPRPAKRDRAESKEPSLLIASHVLLYIYSFLSSRDTHIY